MSQKIFSVSCPSNPALTFLRVRWCDTFFSRLRGFTFRKTLALDEGLVLVESRETRVDSAIHMLFVWSDLAVFWLDADFHVVDKALAKSWRPFYAPKRPAQYTLEISPSRLEDFQIGDPVSFTHE